jgi:hypothetical protein
MASGMQGYGLQQAGAGGLSPFQGVMSILGVVGGMAQFADAALEAVHVFLNLSARLCDRLGWARQELSGAVAAAAAAAAAARTSRSSSSTSSHMSTNLRRMLICAAVRLGSLDVQCVVIDEMCSSGRCLYLDHEAVVLAPQGFGRYAAFCWGFR